MASNATGGWVASLGSSLRTPTVRRQILITLALVLAFRVGSFLPSPGVDVANMRACVAGADNLGLSGLLNVVSGGAMLQLSVFALGIMPYITATIIVQLLRVVIPHFEALHQEGGSGRDRLTQYTRYLTIALAILQSITLVITVRRGLLFAGCGSDSSLTPILSSTSIWTSALLVLTLVAGTGLVMWLAEVITDKGIGNGMSILIFTSIIAALPAALWGASVEGGIWVLVAVIVLLLALVLAVTYVESSQRRITVVYPKQRTGMRLAGAKTTYIPLKVNMAGVVPVIFATSILMLPHFLTELFPRQRWAQWLFEHIADQTSVWYLVLLGLLILGFAFFYSSITFNPIEQADNLSRYGGFIPGKRPGRETAAYLGHILNRLQAAGAVYLVAVALVPTIVFALLHITTVPFGGTSLLIVVSVGLDTVKQARARTEQYSYETLLRTRLPLRGGVGS